MAKKLLARLRLAGCLVPLTLLVGCLAPDEASMMARAPGETELFGPQGARQALPVSIFVASTRLEAHQSGEAGEAHFALDIESVPPTHQAGRVELPTFGAANPSRDFALTLARPLPEQEFLNQIAMYLSGRVGSNRDVLVYVHGFNTSEDQARERLAQIVTDGRFGGVPVLFTWPADGGPLSYVSDKDLATTSRDALEKLLTDLSHTPDIGRVNIIGHSMGAWLTMEALRENAIAGHHDLDGRLGQVMLAAPDIDLSVFREQVARIGNPGRISVYVSKKDRALSLSAQLHGDRPRLGAIDPNNPKERALVEKIGVHVYDLSGFSRGFLGHGVFADTPQVLRSVGARLDAPRKEDGQTAAVIDLGVDHSAPAPLTAPSPGADAIQTSPLAPVGAAQTGAAPIDAVGSIPPTSPAVAATAVASPAVAATAPQASK